MTDRLLTVAEVAYMTDEPAATIRRWIYEGVIPVERVGPYARVRIRLSVVHRMYPPDLLRTLTHPDAPCKVDPSSLTD